MATANPVLAETINDGAVALDRCADYFDADRIGCNMVAASLGPANDAVELIRVHEGDRTLGAAVAWPPGYTLTRLLPGAADVLADELPANEGWRLMGEAGDAAAVAGRWSERTGGSIETVEIFRVYRLADLQLPDVPGRLVVAGPDQIERAAEWAVGFGADTGLPHKRDAAVAQMTRAVDGGRLRVWEVDDEPVAQLLVSAPAFRTVRIGGVYTPPERRRHGFGAALTAAVAAAERARPNVDEVMLNTQASNAMTNRLYRRLGFESVYETLIVMLTPGADTDELTSPPAPS